MDDCPLPPLQDIRCPDCNRLLLKARIATGTRLEIICPHCPRPQVGKKHTLVIERKAA